MGILRNGEWAIMSVLVNSETVMNYEGFVSLQIRGEELSIEPIGLKFHVRQSTSRSAVLESRGQVYFADFLVNEHMLQMQLTRPRFDEKVVITAEFAKPYENRSVRKPVARFK